MLEDDIQYGHEIYINTNGNGSSTGSFFDLYVTSCDKSSKLQQFILDSNSNSNSSLLQLTNGKYCALSTGSSDPVSMVTCDSSNSKQQWSYNNSNSLQIKSMSSGNCLDVAGEAGPAVDEWSCKDPNTSDASNQQWYYNITTGMFISKWDSTQCLTAVANQSNVFAYVYENRNKDNKVTFIINIDINNEYKIFWEGIEYDIPIESVSIIDNSGIELFNTGKVDTTDVPTERIYKPLYKGGVDLIFESWSENVPLTNNNTNTQNRSDNAIYNRNPYEQIRFSNNTSEYLYYSTSITTDFSSINGKDLELQFEGQIASSYYLWFNDEYIASDFNFERGTGPANFSFTMSNVTNNDCSSSSSTNSNDCIITILSCNLGISTTVTNEQGPDSQDKKGITGKIWLYDITDSKIIDDYTNSGWYHWIGTTGEVLNITGAGSGKIKWNNPAVTSNPMTWYRTSFITPDIQLFNDPDENANENESITGVLLLDIGSGGKGMQRGHWWLNGRDMGHYNNVVQSNGIMVQQYYFIPLDYLVSNSNGANNTLVFEEELPISSDGNDVSNVRIVYSTFVIPVNVD